MAKIPKQCSLTPKNGNDCEQDNWRDKNKICKTEKKK